MHRLQVAAAALLVATATCTDAFAPTNTDVGLYVWAEVTPHSLSIRDSTTEIVVSVYVQNPSGADIRVRGGGPPFVFATDPALSKGLWGSFRIGCPGSPLSCGPGVDWFGDSVFVVAAGRAVTEKRAFTLKEWKQSGYLLGVRAHFVRAWFNGREGNSATLNVTP